MGLAAGQGASAKELLVEAARRNNVELMQEVLEGKSEAEAADLLNKTTTVMGNHLYHEAAAQGNCAYSQPPSPGFHLAPPGPSPPFPG